MRVAQVICLVAHPLLSPIPLASTPPVIDELLGQFFGGYCLPFHEFSPRSGA